MARPRRKLTDAERAERRRRDTSPYGLGFATAAAMSEPASLTRPIRPCLLRRRVVYPRLAVRLIRR
jgi:hypothetical protein